MALYLIITTMLIFSISCITVMIYQLRRQPTIFLSTLDYCKLISSGVIAFIADTLGVGSFAVNVALSKLLGTFHDDELPAVNNGAQVIPGTIESLFFMQIIDVDLVTLFTLVLGTCIGGVIGGNIVSHLSKQAIRFAMLICFFVIICLLFSHQFNLISMDGDLIELRSWRLTIGFFAMIVCGALTSVGIGLFAMVQGVLFLLSASPLIAFPIMTTAGAMQQPLTTLVFLKQHKIPLKKTLVLSLAGCLGVFITLPLFNYLTFAWLHSFLIVILIFNFIAIGRSYLHTRSERIYHSQKEVKSGYTPPIKNPEPS